MGKLFRTISRWHEKDKDMNSKQIRLDGHAECPYCHNITISNLNRYPSANATRCKHCGKIVTRKQFIIANSKMVS